MNRTEIEAVLRSSRERTKVRGDKLKIRQQKAVRKFLEEKLDPNAPVIPYMQQQMATNNQSLVDLIVMDLESYREYGDG